MKTRSLGGTLISRFTERCPSPRRANGAQLLLLNRCKIRDQTEPGKEMFIWLVVPSLRGGCPEYGVIKKDAWTGEGSWRWQCARQRRERIAAGLQEPRRILPWDNFGSVFASSTACLQNLKS